MKRIRHCFAASKNGFSMIELIIAMVVLVIGLIPLLMLLGNVRQGVTAKESHVDANVIAQGYLNFLQTKKWDANSPALGVYTPTPSSTLGAETGETSVDSFDDIDDFNGVTIAYDSRNQVSFDVSYVTLGKNGSMSASAFVTNCKLVVVTVTVTGKNNITTKSKSIFINENLGSLI